MTRSGALFLMGSSPSPASCSPSSSGKHSAMSSAASPSAYLRGGRVATLVQRWNIKLGGSWGSTTVDLPAGNWKNVLTREAFAGGRLRINNLLQRFPVALLIRED